MVGVDSRLISGREKLDSLVKIERSTKTFIDVDRVYRQASIYGSDANKKKARAKLTKLMAEVHSCKNMAVEVSVPLEGVWLFQNENSSWSLHSEGTCSAGTFKFLTLVCPCQICTGCITTSQNVHWCDLSVCAHSSQVKCCRKVWRWKSSADMVWDSSWQRKLAVIQWSWTRNAGRSTAKATCQTSTPC